MHDIKQARQIEPPTAARDATAPTGATAFADNRSSTDGLRQLRALADASPQVAAQRRLNARAQQESRRAPQAGMSSPALQRKSLAGLSAGAALAEANQVYFTNGAKSMPRLWNIPGLDQPSRTELLQDIAGRAGRLGVEIDGKLGAAGWNPNPADSGKELVASFDPLRVRFAGQYGPPPGRNMVLDYHFGDKWSGYVIHVNDAGIPIPINQEMHEPLPGVRGAPPAGKYSNIHAVHRGANPNVLANNGDADSATKIAGEGARWQCIASHGGVARDDSRIYTNESSDTPLTPNVRYIIFPDLWKSWAATFDKKYNIADATVAEELTAANIRVTTKDGVVNRAVGVAAASTMRYGIDIPVDDPGPARQTDLNPKTIKYLFIKKKKPVIETRKTLDAEVTDAKTELARRPGVTIKDFGGGYVQDKVFAFLCETTAAAVPAGMPNYTEVAERHATFSYPGYRAPKLDSLAAQTAQGTQVGAGADKYAEEKTARYEEFVTSFKNDIAEAGIAMPDGGDVDTFVRQHVAEWPDVASALPQNWYTREHDAVAPEDFYAEALEQYRAELEGDDDDGAGEADG
jgi:hypothetical protein